MKKTTIYLDEAEWRLVILALNGLRTKHIMQGRDTSFLDDLLLKIITAPIRNVKIA